MRIEGEPRAEVEQGNSAAPVHSAMCMGVARCWVALLGAPEEVAGAWFGASREELVADDGTSRRSERSPPRQARRREGTMRAVLRLEWLGAGERRIVGDPCGAELALSALPDSTPY